MTIDDLKGKLVAVLGFAKEGKATARYLLKHGVKPVLFDQKPWEEWSKEEQDEIKSLGLQFIFGPDAFLELAGFDVAFKSPGISGLKIKDLRFKTTITSQTKWFFEHCPANIVGVTGTKGKGTTCSLIYEILQTERGKIQGTSYKPYLTGNIGKVQPFEILDDLADQDVVVYELSSFQLQDLTQSPHIGVVLMVTEDHLDVHSSLEEYRQAKESITKFQNTNDFAIVNADFETSEKIGSLGSGQKIYFSRKQLLDSGCFVDADKIRVNIGNNKFEISTARFQLPGAHNLENFCAAISAATVLEVEPEVIQSAVDEFKGLEHRLEFVSEVKGVRYYNDSISTNPDTAIAGIHAFTQPEILILGGSSKNSDFTQLGKTIADSTNIKALILIGQEAVRIQESVDSTGKFTGTIITGAKSMAEIFSSIQNISTPGDVVLLSPACASFDMFRNYQERGEKFKAQVALLRTYEQGELRTN